MAYHNKVKITRIRYLEENGVLTSGPLVANKRLIMIRINLRTLACDIISETGKYLVRGFKAKNRGHALKVMRNKVKALDVKMYDEVKKK